MSEEKKAANMFGPGDTAAMFCSILTGTLEDLASKGDPHGCLEIIKFMRRFVADVPVTDYRTVGYPEAIKSLLDACGLALGKDYSITTSSLDSESNVIAFARTAHTDTFLGCVAGLRVASGPSVCDRLYCELCKDAGRDFGSALTGNDIGGRMDFKTYVVSRTEEVYRELTKELQLRRKAIEDGSYKPIGSPKDEELEMEAMAYAEAQIQASSGRILPTASPVAPIAVAEAYWRMAQRKCGLLTPDKPVLFLLGKNPGEWISAKPFSRTVYAPSGYTGAVPLQALRKSSRNFDSYMPNDTGSFCAAETGSAVADCLYAVAGCPVRFPGEDIPSTIKLFNAVEQRRELISFLTDCYATCYPLLGIAFYSKSGVRLPVGSKFAKDFRDAVDEGESAYKILSSLDETLGLEVADETPALVFTSAFVMSPFESAVSLTSFEHTGKTTVVVRHTGKETPSKKSKASKSVPLAESWFEFIHNCEAPAFTNEEAVEKMTGFLEESAHTTEEGGLPIAVAIGMRTAIAKLQDKAPTSRLKSLDVNAYIKSASADGLHTPAKFVTQLVSTVTGSGTKTVSAFVKERDAGKQVSPPGFPAGDHLFPHGDAEAMTRFLEIADTSNLQTSMPRKVSDFVFYAETNISYSTLCELYENVVGFSLTFVNSLCAEIGKVLFGGMIEAGPGWKRYEKIHKGLGANSAIVRLYNGLLRGEISMGFPFACCIESDKHKRAVVVVKTDRTAALLAMMYRAPEEKLDGLIAEAIKHDPSSVFVSEEGWKGELCDYLLGEAGGVAASRRLPRAETIGTALLSEADISPDVYLQGLFSQRVLSSGFQYLSSRSSDSAAMDPN